MFFNLLTGISRVESALIVLKFSYFSPTKIPLPLHAILFLIFLSSNWANEAHFLSFSYLLSGVTTLSPVQGVSVLWKRCQEGVGWSGAAGCPTPWSCAVSQASPGLWFHLLDTDIDDKKLIPRMLSCFLVGGLCHVLVWLHFYRHKTCMYVFYQFKRLLEVLIKKQLFFPRKNDPFQHCL